MIVVVVPPALPQPPAPAANSRDNEKIIFELTPGMKRGFFAVIFILLTILALKVGVDLTGLIPTRI
ncbi:hypothetical protein AB0O28_39000 [Microbispora sp. NPDC088329]|uniref:hypothetical protein n=1 Tax=Microbispora sp. NPDC088329 TaxID=3154869 RepID=UPI003444A581